MKIKTIRQRNLPLSEHYQVLSVRHGSVLDGVCTACDNCNKIISHIVTVQNRKGEQFQVGLDCAKTLTFSNYSQFSIKVYIFNQVVKFMQQAIKPTTEITLRNECVYAQWEVTRKDGGTDTHYASQFTSQLNEYMPDWRQKLSIHEGE